MKELEIGDLVYYKDYFCTIVKILPYTWNTGVVNNLYDRLNLMSNQHEFDIIQPC